MIISKLYFNNRNYCSFLLGKIYLAKMNSRIKNVVGRTMYLSLWNSPERGRRDSEGHKHNASGEGLQAKTRWSERVARLGLKLEERYPAI